MAEPRPSHLPPGLLLLIKNLTSFFPVKLDSTNFIIWINQLKNVLQANMLLGYVDGTNPCPQQENIDSAGQISPNPSFLEWIIIDSHLLPCITATLSPAVQARAISCTTTVDLWSSLHNRYTSVCRSHIHELKSKLLETRKETTAEAFLDQLQDYADKLASAGALVSNDDMVYTAMNNLPIEYAAFNTTMRNVPTPITFEEFSSRLIAEEIHLNKLARHMPSSDVTSALNATSYRDSGPNTIYSNRNFNQQNYQGPRPNDRLSARNGFPGGHSRPNNNSHFTFGFCSNNRPIQVQNYDTIQFFDPCQICGKTNHPIVNCFYRRNGPRRANVATSRHNSAQPWFFDSGATNNITHDLQNLSVQQPYHGSDTVVVGQSVESYPLQGPM